MTMLKILATYLDFQKDYISWLITFLVTVFLAFFVGILYSKTKKMIMFKRRRQN